MNWLYTTTALASVFAAASLVTLSPARADIVVRYAFSPNAFITNNAPGGPLTTDISGTFSYDATTNTATAFNVTLSGAVSGTFTTGNTLSNSGIGIFVGPGATFVIPFASSLSLGATDNLIPLLSPIGVAAGGSAVPIPDRIIPYTFSPNAFITNNAPGGPLTTDISGTFSYDATTNTASAFDVTLSGAVSGTFTTGNTLSNSGIGIFVGPGATFVIPFASDLSLGATDNLIPLLSPIGVTAGGSADPPAAAPEPSSLALLGGALALFLSRIRASCGIHGKGKK